MSLEVEDYVRKPFTVQAVRVTADNMEEVAVWCGGSIQVTDKSPMEKYIKVRVQNPLTTRQTMAFVNDWVLYAGKGYKVYTPAAFGNSFDKVESVVA